MNQTPPFLYSQPQWISFLVCVFKCTLQHRPRRTYICLPLHSRATSLISKCTHTKKSLMHFFMLHLDLLCVGVTAFSKCLCFVFSFLPTSTTFTEVTQADSRIFVTFYGTLTCRLIVIWGIQDYYIITFLPYKGNLCVLQIALQTRFAPYLIDGIMLMVCA